MDSGTIGAEYRDYQENGGTSYGDDRGSVADSLAAAILAPPRDNRLGVHPSDPRAGKRALASGVGVGEQVMEKLARGAKAPARET